MFDKDLVPLYVLEMMDGEIRGRTRFQKLVFLTKQKLKAEGKDIDIDFTRLYYGPFSRDLQDSLETYAEKGIVHEYIEEGSYGLVYVYRLTNRGKEMVRYMLRKKLIKKDVQKKIKEVSEEFGDLNLSELISKVYNEYPQYNPNIKP